MQDLKFSTWNQSSTSMVRRMVELGEFVEFIEFIEFVGFVGFVEFVELSSFICILSDT
jgi:hypothetical protein